MTGSLPASPDGARILLDEQDEWRLSVVIVNLATGNIEWRNRGLATDARLDNPRRQVLGWADDHTLLTERMAGKTLHISRWHLPTDTQTVLVQVRAGIYSHTRLGPTPDAYWHDVPDRPLLITAKDDDPSPRPLTIKRRP